MACSIEFVKKPRCLHCSCFFSSMQVYCLHQCDYCGPGAGGWIPTNFLWSIHSLAAIVLTLMALMVQANWLTRQTSMQNTLYVFLQCPFYLINNANLLSQLICTTPGGQMCSKRAKIRNLSFLTCVLVIHIAMIMHFDYNLWNWEREIASYIWDIIDHTIFSLRASGLSYQNILCLHFICLRDK